MTGRKPGSLKAYEEWLHCEAVRVFLKDKTQCDILFLIADAGMESFIPTPK